jgi:Secretion system C-terminal sorting domain
MQRKLFLLIIGIYFANSIAAQTVFGFEQWDTLSYGIVPKQYLGHTWMSSDSILKKYNSVATKPSVIIATPNNYGVHSGNSALCITSSFYTNMLTQQGDSAGSQLCLGYLDPHTLLPEGIPYTDRPIALEGYYKILGNANELDSAHIFLELLSGNTVVGKINQIFTTPTAQYNYFNIPITYQNNSAITTLKLMFSMGAVDFVTQDTTAKFLLDDIAFVLPTPLKQDLKNRSSSIYPNPCHDIVNINVDAKPLEIIVTNIYGSVVFIKNNVSQLLQINTSAFPSGIYFVRVKYNNGLHSNTSFVRQ